MQTIKRQAGTLDKAVLEGIMNAIEAGATRVDVTMNAPNRFDGTHRLSIADDGIGIETTQEIDEHFETFGTPHTTEELATGKWKQFRMGRGQMFSFGKNTWRTSTFEMVVDIANEGLNWHFEEGLKKVKGCKVVIELYDDPGSIKRFKELVTKQIKYVEVPVYFNGEQVNTPASKFNWDFEDEYAYYLFNVGIKLEIYNLGVFVREYDDGIYGVVVSKEQLKVNFARNDIISDCQIYQHIREIVKKNRIKEVKQKSYKRKAKLTDGERIATLKDVRDGNQEYREVRALPLFKTAQGKFLTLNQVSKIRKPWCFVEEGDRYADKQMQNKRAVFFDEQILYALSYPSRKDYKEFFSWLIDKDYYETVHYDWMDDDEEDYKHYRHDESIRNKFSALESFYTDYYDLKSGRADYYNIVEPSKYTKRERAVVRACKRVMGWHGREIQIGESNSAAMWTDGKSYIVIDRVHLKNQNFNYPRTVINFLMDLCHELTHDDNTAGTDIHGPDFYERMVELMREYSNPLTHALTFSDMIRNARAGVEQEDFEAKKAKAEQEIKDRLSGKKKKRGRKKQTTAA